jgi:hypothetical protein
MGPLARRPWELRDEGFSVRAARVMLTADQRGYTLCHRRVDYDRDAVIREMLRLRHPAASYIIASLSGERYPL